MSPLRPWARKAVDGALQRRRRRRRGVALADEREALVVERDRVVGLGLRAGGRRWSWPAWSGPAPGWSSAGAWVVACGCVAWVLRLGLGRACAGVLACVGGAGAAAALAAAPGGDRDAPRRPRRASAARAASAGPAAPWRGAGATRTGRVGGRGGRRATGAVTAVGGGRRRWPRRRGRPRARRRSPRRSPGAARGPSPCPRASTRSTRARQAGAGRAGRRARSSSTWARACAAGWSAVEGPAAGEQLEGDDGERVAVAGVGRGVAAGLLGRDVGGGAEDLAGLGERRLGRRRSRSRSRRPPGGRARRGAGWRA